MCARVARPTRGARFIFLPSDSVMMLDIPQSRSDFPLRLQRRAWQSLGVLAEQMVIRDPTRKDGVAWRRLWDDYCRFYEVSVDRDITEYTWRRILDSASPVIGRVAELDADLLGFSVSVLHEGTWTTESIWHLEDLFVDPEVRRGGIGRALITDLVDRARARGCSRLYWHTRADNVAARRLYDRFVPADDFVRYRLFLS